MLMPAAVLVVLLLGAIAVDLSIVHLRQREAVAAAASAANDAVTAGLDQTALRRGEGYRLDPAQVDQVVAESIESQGLADEVTDVRVTMPTTDSVTVEVRLRAEELFARSLPTGPRTTEVRGTATASVQQR
ncbi:MAG TPA: hypothetical protein VIJ47_00960 [Acidimicrobiales bacterium]